MIAGPAVRGYLLRLGFAEPPPVTVEGLRSLHAAHLEQVPLESLSIPLCLRVDLEEPWLADVGSR